MRNSPTHLKNQDVEYIFQPNLEFSSLADLLRYRALHQAEQRAYTFLVDGETDEVHLTYGQLDRQARAIAGWLQSRGAAGERVLLLYPPGLEYIAAFFGCLYAGCVAVPAYPPRLNRPMPRLQAIIADAQATVALTTTRFLARLERRFDHLPALATLQWLATDSLSRSKFQAPSGQQSAFWPLDCGPARAKLDPLSLTNDAAEQWREPMVSSDTLAFLQYTSGSTAAPKGVMVNHANLLHNERIIQEAFQHTEHDVIFVGWVPLYHDMGLIGNVLQPLYLGVPCILMSPLAFLQKPVRWLQAISTYRATTSGAPNFAYDLCTRKITPEQRATLDLSSWGIAFNGAEPIRPETLARFAATFAPYGFRREAFYPCYGLAEATLFVSGGLKKDVLPVTHTIQGAALEHGRVVAASVTEKGSQTLVGCGRTQSDQKMVIVDPESLTLCPPDRVGEIWVSGPSVTEGYWNRPEETEHTFRAYLADTGAGPFLRTGDLGFLKDGELFITGRLKDLIIIRGRNYYPQDIELAVEQSHPVLRPGCGAAFSVEVNGEERLVIVQEVKRRHRNADVDEVARAIRGAVAESYELPVYAVVLIKTSSISKTTSGKIQRHACREKFLADSLATVGSSILAGAYFEGAEDGLIDSEDAYVAPRTPTEKILAESWAEILELEQAGIYENFFALGGHSLLATQLISRVRETFQVELPLRALFEMPTIAGLARCIEAARQGAQTVQVPPILPISRAGEQPLSFSQERMWFLYQFEPNSAAYHIPLAIRLAGPLDVTILERSFNEIVRRHEALRTTFVNVAGRPVQVIAPTLTLKLPVIDFEEFPQPEREAEIRRLATREAQRPFDIVQGPLLRVTLFRLGAEDYVMLMVMHHLVSDAWSLSLFWQEMASLYEAFSAGQPSPLPELPLQYVDFAHWQRQWLQGETLETQLAYWKQQLAGAPSVLELPADRPRPANQTFQGGYQSFPLPESLVEALRTLSRREGTTLFMTLLAAFKSLLYRYTGQEDILVGTPIANRHWLAVERLMGTFVNTLVMRTDLSGNPTFRELLSRVREVALGAYAHQELPFEQLVETLQPERDLSHSPLVQVMFNVTNPPMPIVQIPNLTWSVFEFDRGAAQFDLTLSLVDIKQIQMMAVEYNTELFDHTTISRMMGHLQVLLESIVATGAEQRLSDLPLLTETERHQLLVEWNTPGTPEGTGTPGDTQVTYLEDLCVHELFETQVERTPAAAAVLFEGQRLTYRELNQRANKLAHYLQGLGVGPDECVAICMERSLEMVVGLLGILKAGGTYVPLDPTYPQQRLAFMLEDSQASVLLTQQRLTGSLPKHEARVVCIDADWETIAKNGEENPDCEVLPGSLAYVIYTSGSTGMPKGVEIPHRAVVNFLNAMRQEPGLTDQDTLLAVTTLSFDIAVLELFLPIISGARVMVVSREVASDGARLIEALTNSEATIMQATPATWRLLLEAGWPGPDRLKMLCGGEALPRELANQLLERGACLWNMYGPTETTIWSTVHKVEPGDRPVPVGHPIANTQIYILDRNLQPVPIGVPGELHIGGVGLARGYHNRPELTREKFIPTPFSPPYSFPASGGGQGGAGARLYKTGDLARYLPDGSLEFLGRIDHQVKLRGFRIELGEIETVLAQYPAVQQTVVVAREDTPGSKHLVAYVVPVQTEFPNVKMLHDFLTEKLPDYMIPSTIVLMDDLPLTSNGKVDRRVLPAPDRVSSKREDSFVAPQDALERELIKIWEETLDIQPISIDDNFFELGGHSLLAVRLFAQMEKVFGKYLPVVTLFQAPTILQLANVLRQEGWSAPSSSLVPIQPDGSKRPFFCVHGMGGGILDYADLARQLGPDQPFYGLQERGLDGVHEPLTKIEAMAAHYIRELRTLQPEGPYFLGGYCYGGTVAFEMARQLQARGQKVALLAIMDNSPPNSGYYEVIWKPRVMVKFLRNLPYWLYDFLQLSPSEMWARVLRKARVFEQEIGQAFHPSGSGPSRTDIEAIIDDDLSQIPEEYHKFLEAHYLALLDYLPQPYPGRVTLFRTRRYSLLGPFDPEMGWNKLAAEGVDVKEISGFHANILQPPYVQRLAEQLKVCLGEAQTNELGE